MICSGGNKWSEEISRKCDV